RLRSIRIRTDSSHVLLPFLSQLDFSFSFHFFFNYSTCSSWVGVSFCRPLPSVFILQVFANCSCPKSFFLCRSVTNLCNLIHIFLNYYIWVLFCSFLRWFCCVGS
ncbi:hypothetical protein Tsubulata_033778, partial [Turnera subulata]